MASIHSHLIPVKLWAVEKSNVMARLRFQRENSIPTVTEIRENLGPNLGEVFMQKLNRTTKALMHLDKNLDGPGHNLWSSPSEQLMGHLTLKRRQMQALTHETILKLGEECMLKKEKEMADRCSQLIDENDARMNELFTKTLELNLNVIRAQEREDFLLRVALMESRLHSKYEAQVEKLQANLKAEADLRVKEAVSAVKKTMEENIKNLLEMKEKLLTQQFLFQLKWTSSDLYEDYKNKLNVERKKMLKTSDSKEVKKVEKKVDQKMISESENKDVTCAIMITKSVVEKEWKQRLAEKSNNLNKVEEENVDLKNRIKQLEEENERLNTHRRNWECVTKEILKQFEKFVAYALKLPLMQANYLLSFQQLIKEKDLFEIEQAAKAESDQKEVSKGETKSESLNTINICYKDIESLMSDLIHRVLPSPTPSQDIVATIMSEIIKKVVISQQNIEIKESSSSYLACPGAPSHEVVVPCVDKSDFDFTNRPPLEFLDDRVSSVVKILNKYPNLKNHILKS